MIPNCILDRQMAYRMSVNRVRSLHRSSGGWAIFHCKGVHWTENLLLQSEDSHTGAAEGAGHSYAACKTQWGILQEYQTRDTALCHSYEWNPLDIPGTRQSKRIIGREWLILSKDQFLRWGHWLKNFRKKGPDIKETSKFFITGFINWGYF